MTNTKGTFGLAIFAAGPVGRKTVEYILQNYPKHLKYLFLTDEQSEVLPVALNAGFDKDRIMFNRDLYIEETINKIKQIEIDYILLAWWPFIIKKPLFDIPKIGILNFHPSMLPFNRGKHYNFWTIVEDTPFGVSIHFIDESIDSGDVIFQKKIKKTWEDNGKTLYEKAQQAMFKLFTDSYLKIVKGQYICIKQDKNKGSFHFAKELEPASEIFLGKKYVAKDLLNLLRARTFPPYPSCHFSYNNESYEVSVEIKKLENNN